MSWSGVGPASRAGLRTSGSPAPVSGPVREQARSQVAGPTPAACPNPGVAAARPRGERRHSGSWKRFSANTAMVECVARTRCTSPSSRRSQSGTSRPTPAGSLVQSHSSSRSRSKAGCGWGPEPLPSPVRSDRQSIECQRPDEPLLEPFHGPEPNAVSLLQCTQRPQMFLSQLSARCLLGLFRHNNAVPSGPCGPAPRGPAPAAASARCAVRSSPSAAENRAVRTGSRRSRTAGVVL